MFCLFLFICLKLMADLMVCLSEQNIVGLSWVVWVSLQRPRNTRFLGYFSSERVATNYLAISLDLSTVQHFIETTHSYVEHVQIRAMPYWATDKSLACFAFHFTRTFIQKSLLGRCQRSEVTTKHQDPPAGLWISRLNHYDSVSKICPNWTRPCAICAETAPSWTMSNGMPPHYPSMELSLIATASCPRWLKAWYSVILSFTKCFNETAHRPLLWVIGPCTDVYAPMAPWPRSRSASTAPVLSLWRCLALPQQRPLHYHGYHHRIDDLSCQHSACGAK